MIGSKRLSKVLGIIVMLGNRLVGKDKRRTKTTVMTIEELKRLLDEAEDSYKNTSSASASLLAQTCSKIHKTKPSLLKLSKDMPSLKELSEKQISWESIEEDLGYLESKFEAFRTHALSLSSSTAGANPSNLTIEDEIEILQSTAIGRFAVETCLEMASAYEYFDAAKESYDCLASSFREENVAKSEGDFGDIFTTLFRFCSFVELANIRSARYPSKSEL